MTVKEGGWLTVAEAACALGVAVSTVYEMVEKNVITHYRIGAGRGRVSFRPGDIEVYLASRKVAAVSDESCEVKSSSRHLRPPSPSRRPS